MDDALVLEKTRFKNNIVKYKPGMKVRVPGISDTNHVVENILSEAGYDFIQYLHFLQLENEPNLMTLSSKHHFYYDFNDLKSIRTLINLKKLNSIRSLESFLQNVVRILPQKANFIGCFEADTGDRSVFSSDQITKYFKGLINYFDLKTDNSLTKINVSRLLEEHKLKVVDITDINGLTYFCSTNNR